jgi:hypothetical protein
MTTICLSVLVGLVIAEFTRGRSRRMTTIAAIVVGLAVLSDGWVDRIKAVSLPPPIPGAERLAGATVLEAPPDLIHRDIQSVFRAVDGGWRTVNGYSGWGPSYYGVLVGAGRAESDGMVTPFQRSGELHVLIEQDAVRTREVIERQPGATRVASDRSYIVYRLPRREPAPLMRPAGQQLKPREVRSQCSSALLARALDGDERSLWQCELWDERQALTIDLGDVRTVGSVVNDLGTYAWLFPGALAVETSEDGRLWTPAWSGSVYEQTTLAAMADPKRLRIVVAFPPRQARYIRMRGASGWNNAPWTIAEIEVWTSSSSAQAQ